MKWHSNQDWAFLLIRVDSIEKVWLFFKLGWKSTTVIPRSTTQLGSEKGKGWVITSSVQPKRIVWSLRHPRKQSECSSIVHSFSAKNALGWMSSKMIKWKRNRIVDLRRDFAIFRGYLLCTALISFSSVFNVTVYAKSLQSGGLSNLINLVNAQSERAYLLFSSWQFYICRYKRVSERD